jgi:hypothetical protein
MKNLEFDLKKETAATPQPSRFRRSENKKLACEPASDASDALNGIDDRPRTLVIRAFRD